MTALFEPEIKFDLSFVFRKGKNQIPRIANFLNAFDAYLSDADYIEHLKKINTEN